MSPAGADVEPRSAGAAPRPAATELPGCFIVGVARSGTSLLKSLLDGHPQLMVPPYESTAIDWYDAEDPVATFFDVTKYDEVFPPEAPERDHIARALRSRVTDPPDLGSAVLAYVEAMQELYPPPADCRMWVEKTPKHLHVVPVLLQRLGPATRVICIVRDPRAVMGSQARRWGRHTLTHVRKFARRWAACDALTRLFSESYPEQFLAIRYEDLVDDTRSVMARVVEHLGIAWDDGLAAPTRGGRPWGGNSSYREPHSGVSKNPLTRYTEELSRPLIVEIERLLSRRMATYGYVPVTTPAARAGWRGPWLELSVWRALREERRRWRRLGGDTRASAAS